MGFSLLFFDPMAPQEKQWKYVIELAYDPHNPPPQAERDRLTKAFEYIMAGVKQIMEVEEENQLSEYVVTEPSRH